MSFLALAIFACLPPRAFALDQAAFCKIWTASKVAPAEYQPGVDVHGNLVVPADVSAPPPGLQGVRIPVTVDLAQKFGIAMPAATAMTTNNGLLEIGGDGKVYFGGKDLTQTAADICNVDGEGGKKAEKEIPSPPPKQKKQAVAPEAAPQPDLPKEKIIWGEDH